MRLADFIQANTARILDDAVEFAITQTPPGVRFDLKTLRNDIPLILEAIVLDLRTAQSPAQQRAKSEGRAPVVTGPESAATSHGRSRAHDGFGVNQMVAEYRALRASVLRLWAADQTLAAGSVEDLIRFNEAIDQAVAESLLEFSLTVESWRHVFLGALGHDLRGPLQAVVGTADLLVDGTRGTPHARQAERILSGSLQLGRLVDGLLDYSRSALGAGMGLQRSACDLGAAVADEVELLRASLRGASLRVQVAGDVRGEFDAVRVREAVHNLVTNAAKYGDDGGEIGVSVMGEGEHVRLSVTNAGEPLSGDALAALFDPLRRGSTAAHKGEHASLGLGLFIVREIARAHGGDVTAQSGDGTTTFVIVLPRYPAVDATSVERDASAAGALRAAGDSCGVVGNRAVPSRRTHQHDATAHCCHCKCGTSDALPAAPSRRVRGMARCMSHGVRIRRTFQMTRDTSQRDANRDPLSGAPGAHPVGVGVGGAAGGLAAGAVAGTVFGPIGTLIGAAAGTLLGAAAGKGVAERIDPTGEVEYWRETYRTRPYYSDEYDFQRDYAGVYHAGAVARGEYPEQSWEDTERRLQAGWEARRGESRLEWERARPALQDAWERADRTYGAYAWTDDTYARRFKTAPYRQAGDEFDEYRPAYRYGTYARGQYIDREWDDSLAADLERGWGRFKGGSRLSWERAKHAVADAFTLDRQKPH